MTGTHEKKHYRKPNLLPLERYSLNLFPQRDVPFFKGEANMKLSLPNNSIRPCLLALASVLILPAPAAHAVPITFELNLSGANEVPQVSPAGTGSATVVLDPDAKTLTVSATFSGLTSSTTAAHIHCCAPLGTDPMVNNAMVATLLPAFTDFPIGVTFGTYPAHIFDLNVASSYNPAFITAHGGLAQAEADFLPGLLGALRYWNTQTEKACYGEMR